MNKPPKYNVTVLIENNVSAEIWKSEIEDFKNKLNENPQFTSINTYTFGMNEKLLIKDENNNPINLLEQTYNENNLVFVISDASSILWRNSEIHTFLNELKKFSLVSLVNLLPKDMYMVQAIDVNSDIRSNIVENTQNNNQISIEDGYINPNSLVLPVANINKTDSLVSTLINGGALENIQVFLNNEFKESKKNTKTIEQNAEDTVQRYKQLCYVASASIEPFQLAAFFSEVESFTVSDVDFVRQYMLPASNKSILNPFMLGGIVEKTNGEAEETRYKMKECVDLILRRSLRGKDYETVKLLLDEKNSQSSKTNDQKVTKYKM